MPEVEKEKEDPQEERDEEKEDEEEEAEVTLTQLIDRNRFLIEGLKDQLDKAKKRMMDSPEE